MTKFLTTSVLALALVALAVPAHAQHRRGGSSGGGSASGSAQSSGPAVPRGNVSGGSRTVVVAPRGGYYGRPYYYGPGLSFGLYAGYPYFYPYYYPYGYYGYYGAYGYPYTPYGAYPYGAYAIGGYGEGSVRIKDAPRNAQVFADGYYVGTVDDFDGAFQHLDLEPGKHHIEIREEGQPATSFDVNIRPGETVTYHAK